MGKKEHSKAGFTRSSFLQKDSCLNILSACKVPRKIIEQDCWQYCAIKILPRVKALFKKKTCLAAILLGIERDSIFQQDFRKFLIENAIWSITDVCAAPATGCYRHPMHSCGQAKVVSRISAFYVAYLKLPPPLMLLPVVF